jgi:hypothetical protein
VQVTYKRPTTEYSLRKITHFLPEVLEDSKAEYREEFVDTRSHAPGNTRNQSIDADAVYIYADRKVRIEKHVTPTPTLLGKSLW